jgi:hypothetical protein
MENRNTMKKRTTIGFKALAWILTSLSLASCNDAWDAHYGLEQTGKIDSNIYDYISSRSDLSLFRAMIEQTGYDSILKQSKSYTVWAPTNAALAGSPVLTDTMLWKNLVSNHIATYSHPVSQADSLTITMLNGKRLVYDFKDTTATMDGIQVLEKDRATKNGLVQVISDILPFRNNVWDFIQLQPGLDSLRTFVHSLDKKVLDMEKSYDNNVFIDSVFYTTNPVKDYLGHFDLEDSIYTALMPDNAAWTEAYNRISPYYKTKASDGGAAVQRFNTQWTMIQDLFFWGKINTPYSDSVLVSTHWNKLTNPDSLFLNAQKIPLSNGLAYQTSRLYHKPKDTWCKEIRIEAESSIYGRKSDNYEITTLSSLGSQFNVSKNSYISCKPTSPNALSPLTLTFNIPNTLSTKYNIYVVFVPTIISDTTDKRPSKMNFFLSTSANAPAVIFPTTPINPTPLLTDPLNMTKMLVVKNYEFPTTNIVTDPYLARAKTPQGYTSSVTFGLKMRNVSGTSPADLKNFNRFTRVDCIILEPVQ